MLVLEPMVSDKSAGRGYKWKEEGTHLLNARLRRGFKRPKVADKIGVEQQTVFYWESGRSRPKQSNLKALADLYGVSVDELLGVRQPANIQISKTEESIILSIRQIDPKKRPNVLAAIGLLLDLALEGE